MAGAMIRERGARWLRFATLTSSLAGSQIIWSLEIAYGTPYLLSIGLSKQATGLVWIAGPLSGLIVQPILGCISDASTSRYRRRKYIVGSAVIVALSTWTIAFSEPIASFLLDVLGVGLGDWDPVRQQRQVLLVQALSIIGFWVLDFAINGLQVISRALILDSAGTQEQNEANAWHARMLHFGNIVGYWCGWDDLSEWPALRWVHGGQFRKLAIVALVGMSIGVSITCTQTPETDYQHTTPPPMNGWRRISASLQQIYHVARHLPDSIRRVCITQLFATMSWFSFLFYSTTYIAEFSRRNGGNQGAEDQEETGSLGMLLFAGISMAAGSVLPSFTHGPLVHLEDTSTIGSHTSFSWWQVKLRTMWILGALLQAGLLFSTLWITTQKQAMALVALMGIPWSIWTWVPFALLGEFVREAESVPSFDAVEEQWSAQQIMEGRPERMARNSLHESERPRISRDLPSNSSEFITDPPTSYIPSIVSRGREMPGDSVPQEDSIRGGTILGIHNLAIVVPQLFVALVSSLIFRITSTPPTETQPGTDGDVACVLRFGACMALGAALLAHSIPLTQSERNSMYLDYEPLQAENDEEDDIDEEDNHS
ncbi:hypothetical protein MYAM1_002589 [Malassezia yamatoensis]|uniref:General alpha-glucoside permease n=1 Tax=Malassezia yamatoensis TaxID=253288 RepID=A0AAJ5YSF0_9BASI|nr:hypothetical protein MYAM1_002589 [Malassezia yamatoensis]